MYKLISVKGREIRVYESYYEFRNRPKSVNREAATGGQGKGEVKGAAFKGFWDRQGDNKKHE